MNLHKPVGWRYDSHRHYLAAKGVKTKLDVNGALRRTNGYIEENTRKHVKSPTFAEFTRDVVRSARHPMEDADEQWKSDQLAAGRTPTLSSDPVERNQERGAAILGNVVTFANVEPLLDKNEHKRPAKTQLFDFMLGRRMTEERYMAKKDRDLQDLRDEFPYKSEQELSKIRDAREKTQRESDEFDKKVNARMRAAAEKEYEREGKGDVLLMEEDRSSKVVPIEGETIEEVMPLVALISMQQRKRDAEKSAERVRMWRSKATPEKLIAKNTYDTFWKQRGGL